MEMDTVLEASTWWSSTGELPLSALDDASVDFVTTPSVLIYVGDEPSGLFFGCDDVRLVRDLAGRIRATY